MLTIKKSYRWRGRPIQNFVTIITRLEVTRSICRFVAPLLSFITARFIDSIAAADTSQLVAFNLPHSIRRIRFVTPDLSLHTFDMLSASFVM